MTAYKTGFDLLSVRVKFIPSAKGFGLRIPYLTMNKAEFLEMVEEMATLYGIELDREDLRAEAVKWEMHHPGRTPRVARQFIMSLMV